MVNNDIELKTKLANIQRVIKFNELTSRNANIGEVAKYYKLNRVAYSLFHNRGGFIHMGISEGSQFKEPDLLVQPKLIGEYVEKYHAGEVLELATGKGSNSLYLAKKYPNTTFYGLDLPNGQLNINNRLFRGVKNLKMGFGDYHKLNNYETDKYDIVFVIEGLCHSSKKELVANEVLRLLKKGGLFIVIDGFLNKEVNELNKDELLAKQLTEKGMMVESFENIDEVKEKIKSIGFNLIYERDYSGNIVPNLARFEKLAGNAIFRYPTLGKLVNKALPNEITFNAVSGYLMPTLFRNRVACYKLLVFQK